MQIINSDRWSKEDDAPEKKDESITIKESRIRGQFHWLRNIIVIGVILLLFSLFFRGLLIEYHCSRKAKCMSQLMQIGLALKQYALDNNEIFPWDTYDNEPAYKLFGKLHSSYITDIELFRCPDSGDEKWDINTAHENGIDKALFTEEACKRSLSYAYSHNQGKPWTEEGASSTRLVADKYTNNDYTTDLFPKHKPINHWTQHNRLNPGRQFVRIDGSASWVNSKGFFEVDPDFDYGKSGNPESDQTGADWWSDPPDKP
jgi:hypothetical protein